MSDQEKLLIIVESPSKTKTIAKYIDNASVIASVGHFKDLPKKEMGIDIENDFAMKIQTMPDRKKFITQLKSEVKKADRILIATDPDREGEAIAADIAEEIKEDIEKVGSKIFDLVVNTASGNKSKSEINGYGDEEFNPWQVGVVM